MELKTLGQLLQNVIENEEKRFSLHEFLLESTEEDRKEIEKKLTEEDSKQFYEFMDGFTFVNETEVYLAVCDYYEKTMDRAISMGECGDMQEVADDYIRDRKLKFEEDEILTTNQ